MRNVVLSCAVMLAAAGGARADFNQWRGPLRNGFVPDSPPLAADWGEQGPKLCWESEEIPGGGNGGYGSVAVAAARAYVFANEKYKVPLQTRTLSEGALRSLGWHDVKAPDELVRAVEAARVGEERSKVERDERRAWIEKWVADHLKTREDRKLHERFVTDRLHRGEKALPLDVLDRLAGLKDKPLPSAEVLDKWLTDNRIEGDVRKEILRAFPTDESRSWDTVYCLGLADGKTLWRTRYEGAPDGRSASSTPCVAAGRCYAAGSDGAIYCLDADTGKEVWKTLPEGRGGTIHSSPLVAEGKVIVLAGQLTALDAAKGAVLWRQKKVTGSESSPMLWRDGSKAYVLCNASRGVACVGLDDGQVLWEVRGGGRSSVAIDGEYLAVFTGRKDDGLIVYRFSAEKADKLWSWPQCNDGAASPVLYNGHVYLAWREEVLCADLTTGKVAWQKPIGSRGYSSPVLADGKLLVLTGKTVTILDADPKECRILGRARMSFCEHASPAISGGRLLLRLNKAVGCYDLRPGSAAPAP